ncbi:MAG TPA: tRNA guanosine(34) transglycosylase Tgt [Acetobacteraceae bacterium]|jgi:queuine tRNA-ribosyltransferase|nr:tRNA guanosine(34) transglycosylase Tgt [Acetobacteraceae bacterium]
MTLPFRLAATEGAARAGVLETAHGPVHTPAFMPVGTQATVKGMETASVRATGAEMVLANAYHLMLRPGAERIAALGGLHRFMDWAGPILTDSGGFQVMSLGALRKISEEGVVFRSHIDGARIQLTPERAVHVQHLLDATITMVLDECTEFPATLPAARRSMELSMRWAARSRAAYEPRRGYGLFGIVQGSIYPELRLQSAASLTALGFDGYAIGGLAVGEGQACMLAMLDATLPALPLGRPRYLMGVGTPQDLVSAVSRGVDLFDCVIPTRAGRTARAFTSTGILNLRNARFAADPAPLDPACACPTCRRHARAYLHHLFKAGEMLGAMLLTRHNLHYYQALMRGLRAAIIAGNLAEHEAALRVAWACGDPGPHRKDDRGKERR